MKLSLDREHAPTTVAMAISVVMLAAAFVLMVLPKPKVGTADQDIKKKTFEAKVNEKNARDAAAKLQVQIAGQIWSGSGDQLASTVPILVAKFAAKHNVQLVSLRPQRTVNAGDLTQLGYLINVTGAFTDVLAFEKELDTSDSRLAVENLQVGASDETTDNVNGTLGIEAYLLTPVPVNSTSKAKAGSTGSKNPASTGTQRSAPLGTNGGGSHVKA